MNIRVIAVGKTKEKYYREAAQEFLKRLGGKFCVSVLEIPAQSILDESLVEKYKELEGEKILLQIKDNSYVIALAIEGEALGSEAFAHKIEQLGRGGVNDVVFVLGGSHGLSGRVLDRADFLLSFSKMTFPHQLARIMLLEQIYRARKILNNETYHK